MLIIIIGMIFSETALSDRSEVRHKIEMISNGYNGIIIKKYSVRKNLPTHLSIEVTDGEILNVSPSDKLLDVSKIGDSIIKPQNENFVYLIKKNGIRVKIYYTRLSYDNRKSKYFPKEWRNKWIESSYWDE